MAINAYIGDQAFYALQGNLSPPQYGYHNIDDPWEFGSGYAETGLKGPTDQIITWADMQNGFERYSQLMVYAQLKRYVVNIRIKIGFDFVTYPNYKVLLVEDITDFPYSPTVAGGLLQLPCDLIARWTVQQVTGVW